MINELYPIHKEGLELAESLLQAQMKANALDGSYAPQSGPYGFISTATVQTLWQALNQGARDLNLGWVQQVGEMKNLEITREVYEEAIRSGVTLLEALEWVRAEHIAKYN